VTRLEQWSKEKVCTVIHFLCARHVSVAEIHLQLIIVYGEEVMSWQSVAKWSSDLKSGQGGTVDNEKSGLLMKASTPENKACAEAAILDNKWVTEWAWLWFGSFAWDSSQDYAGVMLPQDWCAMGSASTVRRPQDAVNGYCSLIPLTVCHSWSRFSQTHCYWRWRGFTHHSTETNCASMEWKHSRPLWSKNFKMGKSAGWYLWCVGTARVYC